MNKTQKSNQVRCKCIVYIGVCAGERKKNTPKCEGFCRRVENSFFCVCVNLEVIISIAELSQQSSEEKALVHN